MTWVTVLAVFFLVVLVLFPWAVIGGGFGAGSGPCDEGSAAGSGRRRPSTQDRPGEHEMPDAVGAMPFVTRRARGV